MTIVYGMKKLGQKLQSIKVSLFIAVGAGAVFPIAALAQSSKILSRTSSSGASVGSIITSKTGLGTNNPTAVTAKLIYYTLTALAIIAVALIIYGGFVWLFSRGNEEEVKKALNILKAAVIGLVVILAAYGIARYVFSVLETSTGLTA